MGCFSRVLADPDSSSPVITDAAAFPGIHVIKAGTLDLYLSDCANTRRLSFGNANAIGFRCGL